MAKSYPLQRHIALLALLRSRRAPVPFSAIRTELAPIEAYLGAEESARRTFERDKRILREAGVILHYDGKGYSLDASALRARPLQLDTASAIVLREALGLASVDDRFALAPEAKRILMDLRSERSPIVTHHITRDPPTVVELVEKLTLAIWRRLRVSFSYRPVKGGDARSRTLEPWGLFSRRGHWYVVGRCNEKNERRTFKIGLIHGLKVIGLPDGMNHFERPEGFDIRHSGFVLPWDWKLHPPEELILECEPEWVELVARHLGGATTIEGTRVRRMVTHAHGVDQLILEWMPRVRVVGPESLANVWKGKFERIAARHGVGT